MDAAAHYRQLVQLGRDEFVATAAPGAFVRFHPTDDLDPHHASTVTIDDPDIVDATVPIGLMALSPGGGELEVFPLIKKAGASFPDRITIGRTPNNDIAIADPSVSRLHAYVKRAGASWLIADAGSKNGSYLAGVPMAARKELALASRMIVRLGEIDLTFYAAAELYAALGGA